MKDPRNFNNFSERIKYIRSLIGLSRAEFCTKIGISYHSLCSWELARSIPINKSIDILIEALKLVKINCNKE